MSDKYRYGGPARVATSEARRRDYRAAVSSMDAAIGKIIATLEKKQQLDNTIIIFFSDNGGSGGADNRPLRGRKGQMWEGGIRVPCIVRWPDGGIPAGVVNDAFLSSLEIFPSLAAATKSLTRSDIVLDGFDWWDTLRGKADSPRTEMFWKRKDTVGVRVGKWKWVDMNGAGGLFDLDADVGETRDLSEAKPAVLAMVKSRYQKWSDEMEAAPSRTPFRDF